MASGPGDGWQAWSGKNVLAASDFTSPMVDALYEGADRAKAWVNAHDGVDVLKHHVVANIFYEPSTRTSCSFAAAALRLGGAVIPITPGASSVKKGETLADTAITAACYANVLVQRHPSVGSAAQAAQAVRAAGMQSPVINAGDGTGEHPTQALLDLYTIRRDAGGAAGKVVVLMGDLRHGRTVHSLARVLCQHERPSEIRAVAPAGLELPSSVCDDVVAAGVKLTMHSALTAELLTDARVLYVTRVQKERFATPEAAAAATGTYQLTQALANAMPADAVIMHPLPRVDEIHPEVDGNPRAKYFGAMRNGLFVRMALLAAVSGKRIPALSS